MSQDINSQLIVQIARVDDEPKYITVPVGWHNRKKTVLQLHLQSAYKSLKLPKGECMGLYILSVASVHDSSAIAFRPFVIGWTQGTLLDIVEA